MELFFAVHTGYILYHKKLEPTTLILIVSIAGIFAGNGFWLGSVLGVIAGVITISRK